MREKLIELLREVQYLGGLEKKIADHLIANGVTIPVRCKDCGAYNTEGCAEGFGWCEAYDRGMMNYDFCSIGGRRTNV